ncbi:tetratricopeptide repeat protein [Opisthorchis viverrini]|uniref:Tetratricopeptide repeat protein n=1 Tax=Opisthorchis viverrini TaxID=6198 RepID=A0A1S8X271_OPIVI|nr:tetratricopeptide repeat protein [Opisthorchis viverrini]
MDLASGRQLVVSVILSEFPGEEIVAADNDPEQEMGDDSLEVTDEMIDAANDKRSEAQAKMSSGDLEAAVALFTEAIKLNPTSALLYARRASCFIKLKKPCAALKDCEKALHLNPDSAAPYKWRGFAHKLVSPVSKHKTSGCLVIGRKLSTIFKHH